ncbi:hypothetical protein PS704_03414 [Pseudomonas fluorescens]|uniref:Fibronectin type-III domain-containing protein n=1 Tax=Pseudomonas fluorescens TaxID=294 RepID=A0A5E7DF66_PSEFL|nr:hypothetical protein PS704_03414 [Pseudomonas fluorescens]
MSSDDVSGSPTETLTKSVSGSEVRICAPGGVRGLRTSPSTAQLTWDEPYATCHLCPDAIGYEVYGWGIARQRVLRPPCELSGLNAGVEYLLYVTAKAAGNNISVPSPLRLFKLTAPTKPGTLELRDSTHASMTLSWSPSVPAWGGTSYRVYLNGTLVKRVTDPEVKLTHLQSHTVYSVEVRAVNSAGVSEPSFATFRTRLRPPSNLRFSQRNGNCRLLWDPAFKTFPSHELSINGQIFTTAPGVCWHYFKLVDVSPGTVPHHLKFEVHAQLDGEVSDVSRLEKTVVDDVPPDQPGTPVASDISDNSVTLKWEPSSDDIGVARYRVVLNGLLLFHTPNTHFTFTQLTSGAYHWVFVRAQDKDGNLSDPSQATVFKTTGQAPAPRPLAPEVSVTEMNSTSVLLKWIYPEENPVIGVRVLLNDEHLKDIVALDYYRVKNLIPNVEYSISIAAFDVFGQLSEPTVLVHVPKDVTPPSKPENLSATEVTIDSVTLAWEDSTDDFGIHEYVIYNNHEYFDRTPLTRYTAVDLLPGTYSFEVCAMDLSGNVSEPAALSVMIEGQLTSAPTNFRFTQATGTLPIPTLKWDAPANMDNVVRYDIVLTGPMGTAIPYSTARTFLQPLLLPRTRYDVSITALNEIGSSLPLIAEITTK